MADNNFNELLIHTLKQIHIRLDRHEAKLDEKADKADIKVLSEDFKSLEAKLDEKADKADIEILSEDFKSLEAKLDEKADKADVKALEQRLDNVESWLDRIESGIGTIKWVIGVGLTAMGVLMAVLKMF